MANIVFAQTINELREEVGCSPLPKNFKDIIYEAIPVALSGEFNSDKKNRIVPKNYRKCGCGAFEYKNSICIYCGGKE